MPESQSSFYFLGRARAAYENITSVQQVIAVWEQLAFIQEQGFVNYETVFEIGDGLNTYRVMYGPVYTIIFQTGPDGLITVLSIRRSGLLRRDG